MDQVRILWWSLIRRVAQRGRDNLSVGMYSLRGSHDLSEILFKSQEWVEIHPTRGDHPSRCCGCQCHQPEPSETDFVRGRSEDLNIVLVVVSSADRLRQHVLTLGAGWPTLRRNLSLCDLRPTPTPVGPHRRVSFPPPCPL